MEPIAQIQDMGLTRLDNALHVLYHTDVYNIIHAVDVTKLGLTVDVMNTWKAGIDTEGDLSLEPTADLNTKLMAEKDAERDKLVTFILNVVHAYTQSPDAAEAKAAAQLEVATNRYKGIQRESAARETAHISGLVMDLKKTENAPLVTTLRLTAAVGLLETANADFDKARAARTTTRANNVPVASEARAKTDAAYERIIILMKAAFISGATPVDRELIASVVKLMNKRMDEVNETFRQSLAQKRVAKEPNDPNAPKDPKTPDQPKPPKDPKQPKDPKDPKPDKPKPDDKPDIKLPEEGPKKPDPKKPEEGGGPDIHLPEE